MPPSVRRSSHSCAVIAVALAFLMGTARAEQVDAPSESGAARTAVVGRVVDAATGAGLDGVEVVLVAPSETGAGEGPRETSSSSGDGAFAFPSVEPGRYSLQFSREGYRESLVTDVVVNAGEERRIEFPLPPLAGDATEPAAADEHSELEEFIVTAEKLEDLISVRIDSDQLLNVMGAEDFSKFAAGDVGEVLERVAGVNVVDGQFAIIRGLEDRYSSTTLNGASVPSPDPDSQSVQLDLFPSEVVGNLSVTKNFASDQPSNSSGGSINIVTHEYPQDVELSLKAATGWNENAHDNFLQPQGHLNVNRMVNGFEPIGEENGALVYPDLEQWRANGWRFVEGNPVGLQSEKDGGFFQKLDDVLESDYVGTFGGRKVFGGREFRLKTVFSQETDYETGEGFEESRQPSLPLVLPERQVLDENTFELITLPREVLESGGLANGTLGLSEGRYDLTISEKAKASTGFGAFGFDLDEEGNHRIDASFLYTKLQEQAVEYQAGGFLPAFNYEEVFRGQLEDNIPTDALQNVAPNFISNTIVARQNAFANPNRGALAISNFYQSTSYETDRDLWVAQGNGDHRFEPLPGLHFSWAYNQARTTQDESALGMGYFYEPCGFGGLVPCPDGTERIDPDELTSFTPSISELGPGEYVARRNLLLNANSIREDATFYRLDGDYELDFSEWSTFQIGGGLWVENADRDVSSAFLQSPTVASGNDEDCFAAATTDFVCLGENPLDLGVSTFNGLSFANGNLAGMRETSSEASRDIDAWHLRGKLTFWDRIDFLGGFRKERIFIQSLNDPFVRNPATGETLQNLGGPLTFPPRFLFVDRVDNPFNGEPITPDQLATRGEDFAFNDQLLGIAVQPGRCEGDDGSIPGINCVDFTDEFALSDFFNGEIDEDFVLPSAGFTLRPFEGLTLRGAWSRTVARPSFRELGYYVTVEPGTDDLIVGNPQLQLSKVESYDARVEYTWGERGDLFAVSYFTKTIDTPIEALLILDPGSLPDVFLYQTYFNNPDTADLSGVEAEARVSFGFFEDLDLIAPYAPDWLEFLSIGGNYTAINAEVNRTDVEIARAQRFYETAPGDTPLFTALPPTRRLFNQPEWIANADISFDHPDWGLRATLAYFAISDVLDAAGSATLNPDGTTFAYVPDRYVGSYMDLRATISQTFPLPGNLGEMTFSATAKNLTDSSRKLIYDTTQTGEEIREQELRWGRDYSFGLTFRRRF